MWLYNSLNHFTCPSVFALEWTYRYLYKLLQIAHLLFARNVCKKRQNKWADCLRSIYLADSFVEIYVRVIKMVLRKKAFVNYRWSASCRQNFGASYHAYYTLYFFGYLRVVLPDVATYIKPLGIEIRHYKYRYFPCTRNLGSERLL